MLVIIFLHEFLIQTVIKIDIFIKKYELKILLQVYSSYITFPGFVTSCQWAVLSQYDIFLLDAHYETVKDNNKN
jgi:hypothetical protein